MDFSLCILTAAVSDDEPHPMGSQISPAVTPGDGPGTIPPASSGSIGREDITYQENVAVATVRAGPTGVNVTTAKLL